MMLPSSGLVPVSWGWTVLSRATHAQRGPGPAAGLQCLSPNAELLDSKGAVGSACCPAATGAESKLHLHRPPLPRPPALQGNKGHCQGDTGHRRGSFQRRPFLQPQTAPRQSGRKSTSFTGRRRPLAGRPGRSDKVMGTARAEEGAVRCPLGPAGSPMGLPYMRYVCTA